MNDAEQENSVAEPHVASVDEVAKPDVKCAKVGEFVSIYNDFPCFVFVGDGKLGWDAHKEKTCLVST